MRNTPLMPRNICIGLLLAAFGFTTPAQAQPNTFAGSLVKLHAGVAQNIVEAAEKMSEADFAFTPNKDVRTFGGFVGHIANAAYFYCASATGKPSPNKENFEKATSKAVIVAGIKSAVAFCSEVYKAQTDASLTEVIQVGQARQARGENLVQNISHMNEHYGNLVTYMRLKGIVPPSTERANAAAASGR